MVVEVVILLALLGVGLWAAKPGWFPGASRRAKTSTQATAKLEAATTSRDAYASASVVKIGEANTAAPESLAKSFISREVPVALSLLPPPDPMALIEAERRRAAIMEGRLIEASLLYEKASKRAEQLQAERDRALRAREAADEALIVAAAEQHAKQVQLLGLGAAALILGCGFIYLKFTGITPTALGVAVADIRKGTDPTVALDTVLSRFQQRKVNRESRLAP